MTLASVDILPNFDCHGVETLVHIGLHINQGLENDIKLLVIVPCCSPFWHPLLPDLCSGLVG